jgi:hypothetical protein
MNPERKHHWEDIGLDGIDVREVNGVVWIGFD